MFSAMAFAADLPIAAPPLYAPPADFGGWYLRGDIGFSNRTDAPFAVRNIYSNDLTLGARWDLENPPAPLPLARKG